MSVIRQIVARLKRGWSVQALTREQFDKWPNKRKTEYLEIHPHSKFHGRAKNATDDHKARITNEGSIHYFRDRKGKEHVYENADHVEQDLDMLHSQMDKVAKAHAKRPTDANLAKLDDLHDHAKALQHLATDPKSKKALKFGPKNLAHEGLDDPETYIKHHQGEAKAKAKPKPPAAKAPPERPQTPKPTPKVLPPSDRMIGESIIDKHRVPEPEHLPSWVKRKYGHIDDPKRMRMRIAQDIEYLPSAVGHVIDYEGRELLVTDRNDRADGKTHIKARDLNEPDRIWTIKHRTGAKPPQISFKRLGSDEERAGPVRETKLGGHHYEPDLSSKASIQREVDKIPKWMHNRYGHLKNPADRVSRIYEHLKEGVIRPGNVIEYKGKDYMVTDSSSGRVNNVHKLLRMGDNTDMRFSVPRGADPNVKFKRFATDDEYSE